MKKKTVLVQVYKTLHCCMRRIVLEADGVVQAEEFLEGNGIKNIANSIRTISGRHKNLCEIICKPLINIKLPHGKNPIWCMPLSVEEERKLFEELCYPVEGGALEA